VRAVPRTLPQFCRWKHFTDYRCVVGVSSRHLVPLAKRVDKDNLLKELNVPQPQDGSQKAVEELESALVDSIPAKETKEALK
jgi:hypothetical protein